MDVLAPESSILANRTLAPFRWSARDPTASTGCRCTPAELAALNYVGALATVTVLFPTLRTLGRLGSVAAGGPLAVIWSGLVVVKLLRYRMTINDHAAARDSKADRQVGATNGVFATFTESPISDVREPAYLR
jgi:hypothetical protein